MNKVSLRKLKSADEKYFAKWWRNKNLLRLTSGILEPITNQETTQYFLAMLASKTDYHFMIMLDKETIGHISLIKKSRGWHEIQIIIGKKQYWGKGYGQKAIRILISKAKKLGISKIYLEVRPTNIRAIHAYKQCGFQGAKTIFYPKNKFLPRTLRMELSPAF